jgi:hypothetical protein
MPSDHVTRPYRRMGRVLLRPVRGVHARIAARLDAQDMNARARGWTVEARPFGGRVYRDPRFDRLAQAADVEPVIAGKEAR